MDPNDTASSNHKKSSEEGDDDDFFGSEEVEEGSESSDVDHNSKQNHDKPPLTLKERIARLRSRTHDVDDDRHHQHHQHHHLNVLGNELHFKHEHVLTRPMPKDANEDERRDKREEDVNGEKKGSENSHSSDGNSSGGGLIESLKKSIQSVLSVKETNIVFNGIDWTHVSVDSSLEYVHNNVINGVDGDNGKELHDSTRFRLDEPPPAIVDERYLDDGNGNKIQMDDIYVSLPSFRDSKRCGETLFSIYTNATQPLKVHVGLVEQVHFDSNTTCIKEYCELYKTTTHNINEEQRKILDHEMKQESQSQINHTNETQVQCPYKDQISIIQLSTFQAKGSSYARALSQRKLLSNEQYCLSIDSHSQLIEAWDDVSKKQWKSINNEFAVLSNQPAIWFKEKKKKDDDDAKKKPRYGKFNQRIDYGNDWQNRVYMNCFVLFNDYGIPYYHIHYDKDFNELMAKRENIRKRPSFVKERMKIRNRIDPQTKRRRLVGQEELAKEQTNNRILLEKEMLKEVGLRGRRKEELLNKRIHAKNDHIRPKKDTGERKNRNLPRLGPGLWDIRSGKRFPKLHSVNGVVEELTKPLLSYSWSSSFSFSKCHLDTSVPYDNFFTQLYDTEEFTRYVRMFTRGYDVYTPTTNIVYHDYKYDHIDFGHGKVMTYRRYSWPHDEHDKLESIERAHSILGTNTNGEKDKEHANLGIYGLGKLRSLEQLEDFVGINLKKKKDNFEKPTCGKLNWVPYQTPDHESGQNHTSLNTNIELRKDDKNKLMQTSPMDNLQYNADDLDPQPEFPKRRVSRTTLSTYYSGSKYQSKHQSQFISYNESDPMQILIFCFLMFLLLKMRNVLTSDIDVDFNGWIVDKMKRRKMRNAKLQKSKKSM